MGARRTTALAALNGHALMDSRVRVVNADAFTQVIREFTGMLVKA